MSAPSPQPALPRDSEWRRVVYASGNLGKNIFWGTTEITLMFMLTDLLGVAPAVAGAIVLVSLLVDISLDMLVGVFSQKVRGRLGRYGPFILLGAPLTAVLFVLLYALPLWGVRNVALIALLVVLARGAYALVDVPHNVLLVQVSRDSRTRSRISGYRLAFSASASLLLALSIGRMSSHEGAALSPQGLFQYAVIAASIACTALLASWWVVRQRDAASSLAAPPAPLRFAPMQTLRAVFAQRSLLVALLAGTLATLLLPLFSKSLLYVGRYLFEDSQLAAQAYLALVIGQFAGVPVWVWLSIRWEKAASLQCAHAVCALACVLALAAGMQHKPAYIAASALVGFGSAGVYALIWAMLADCVDNAQRSNASGNRSEGTVFALAVVLQKIAIAVASLLFGLGLQHADYTPDQLQSPTVQHTITAINLWLPLLGAIGCIVLLFGYRITHRRHALLVKNGA